MPLGWLVFLFMVFYLLLNLTNALTQEYFQPPFVVILVALGLMASGPAADPPGRRIHRHNHRPKSANDAKPKMPDCDRHGPSPLYHEAVYILRLVGIEPEHRDMRGE